MDSLLLYKILRNRTGAEISASGNPATLPGTLKNNPMNEMKIFGRSKQETTTGAQLWEFGDIKSSVVAAKKFSASLKKGKYTITADIESTDTDLETCLVTIGKKYINLPREKGVSATFELTEESAEIRVYASEDYNNSVGDTVSLKNVMLNVGDTALPYEPYTGGQPSPSTDYPQEIVSAVSDGKINLEVHGKNLFNLEYALNQKNWMGPSSYWYIPYYVGKGNTVSVTYGAEIPTGLRAYICIHDYPGKTDNAKMWLYHSAGGNLANNKCTFIAEADYIYLNAAGAYLSVIKKIYGRPTNRSISIPDRLRTIP